VSGRAAHRRRLAIVAILASARGRPVGRERIIGLLWPDNPADAARHTLSEGLYILRKELGEASFVTVGNEVGLDPARVRSDVDDFQRAVDEGRWEDAVQAYGGPFLDGFYVSDAPEFERWAEGERDRLARAYGRALEELATQAEARGEPVRAAEWWRRLLAHDAFSSRVALRLVRGLERAGERAAALRSAEAHVLLLRQELGVGPDPELAGLMEELRREPPPPPPPRERPPVEAGVDAGASPAAGETDAGAAEGPAPGVAREEGGAAPAPAERPKPRRRRVGARAAAALGAMAAVLVLAAIAAALDPPRRPDPELDPRRIAVLYLDDDSPGGELQYLANGLTEMLIHELSQVEALDVVSRNGVKPYRQGTVTFDSMVAQLRVGTVVEGSVQRSGDSVRVVVQMIDASTHSHLESRVIVRALGDVLALERAVSEEVGGFLRRRMGAQVRLRQARQETRSGPALELVLRGEQVYADAVALHQSPDSADVVSAFQLLHEADALLARAEAEDPRWVRPVVGRAWVSASEATWREDLARGPALDSAEARANRVLARQPDNARALEARGWARWIRSRAPGAQADSLLQESERDLRAAVAAEPSLASAWGALSFVLILRGRMAESDLAAQRALELDAWLENADQLLERRYFSALFLGDYRGAADACERGRRAFPRKPRFVECRLTLMRQDPSRAQDTALAWRLVAELERLDPPGRAAAAGRAYDPVFRRMIAAAVSARAGDTARARAELARARVDAAVDPDARVSLIPDEAYLLYLLGDRAAAVERMRVYLAQRPQDRALLEREPTLRLLLPPPSR
jgi:DNA-binding SARP family transcriptional activator/TolB-like protein/tetratricopeptide (TPR) repeat protein